MPRDRALSIVRRSRLKSKVSVEKNNQNDLPEKDGERFAGYFILLFYRVTISHYCCAERHSGREIFGGNPIEST